MLTAEVAKVGRSLEKLRDEVHENLMFLTQVRVSVDQANPGAVVRPSRSARTLTRLTYDDLLSFAEFDSFAEFSVISAGLSQPAKLFPGRSTPVTTNSNLLWRTYVPMAGPALGTAHRLGSGREGCPDPFTARQRDDDAEHVRPRVARRGRVLTSSRRGGSGCA